MFPPPCATVDGPVLLTVRSEVGASYAPTSHGSAELFTRITPRWSTFGHGLFVPALNAGLPASRACVGVGPPLLSSGPSLGSADGRSRLPVPSWSTLFVFMPLTARLQSVVLPAMIVLVA